MSDNWEGYTHLPPMPTEVFADPGRNDWYFREKQPDSVARFVRSDLVEAKDAEIARLRAAMDALIVAAQEASLDLGAWVDHGDDLRIEGYDIDYTAAVKARLDAALPAMTPPADLVQAEAPASGAVMLAALPEVQALVAMAYEAAAVHVEQRNGSIPYRQEIARELRTLTPTEAAESLAARDAEMMAKGMREAAGLVEDVSGYDSIDGVHPLVSAILARAQQIEKGEADG